jgi:hypothetical protein
MSNFLYRTAIIALGYSSSSSKFLEEGVSKRREEVSAVVCKDKPVSERETVLKHHRRWIVIRRRFWVVGRKVNRKNTQFRQVRKGRKAQKKLICTSGRFKYAKYLEETIVITLKLSPVWSQQVLGFSFRQDPKQETDITQQKGLFIPSDNWCKISSFMEIGFAAFRTYLFDYLFDSLSLPIIYIMRKSEVDILYNIEKVSENSIVLQQLPKSPQQQFMLTYAAIYLINKGSVLPIVDKLLLQRTGSAS